MVQHEQNHFIPTRPLEGPNTAVMETKADGPEQSAVKLGNWAEHFGNAKDAVKEMVAQLIKPVTGEAANEAASAKIKRNFQHGVRNGNNSTYRSGGDIKGASFNYVG